MAKTFDEYDETGARRDDDGTQDSNTDRDADSTRSISGANLSGLDEILTPILEKIKHEDVIVAGKYRLVEAIGEGGMGSVWLAEQNAPVKRVVAIKLIKFGFGSKRMLARFEAERQALAVMDHPNIASIFDGGVTDFGAPFFVMELVKGQRVTKYCDENQLSIRERLSLFVSVCRAIHHAHQKGVIHRDIKPSNVLVAEYDGVGMAKVIDFGVAKITDRALSNNSLDTGLGIVGTPHYMSPEQASLDSNDIDTRSDVYSLGVLLYELLTGTTPHRDTDSDSASSNVLKLLERIREEDAVRPSTKVRDSETASDIAEKRRLPRGRLSVVLKNELDWIVMKAIDRNRDRRYESASELAEDIERYLSGDEVGAHPPNRRYKLHKFFQKNKGPVIAASLVTASLVAGMTGTTMGMLESQRQETLAIAETAKKERALVEKETQRALAVKAKERAESAEQLLTTRAEELETVTRFQSSQLSELDPRLMGDRLKKELRKQIRSSLKKKLKREEVWLELDRIDSVLQQVNFTDIGVKSLEVNVIDRAIKTMDEDFEEQPAVLASLLHNTAKTLESLGRYSRAIEVQQRGLSIREELYGDEHKDTISSILQLGYLCESANRMDEAEKHLRRAVALSRAVHGNDHANTVVAIENLAGVCRFTGKLEEAMELHKEVLSFRGQMPSDYEQELHDLTQVNNQATLLLKSHQLQEGERLFREAVDRATELLGEEHPTTTIAIANLGSVLNQQNRLEDAEPYYLKSYENTRRQFGDEHPMTITMADRYGVLLWRLKRFGESVPVFENAAEQARKVLAENDSDRHDVFLNLAVNYREAKLYDRAIELLEEMQTYELSDRMKRSVKLEWFEDVMLSKAIDKAIPWIENELTEFRKTLPDGSPELAGRLAYHAMSYLRLGLWEDAAPLAEEALEIREKEIPERWQTGYSQSMLGEIRMRQGKLDEAEELMLKAIPFFKNNKSGQLRLRWNEIVNRLIELYELKKQPDKVDYWDLQIELE